jgi:hypothetical protein
MNSQLGYQGAESQMLANAKKPYNATRQYIKSLWLSSVKVYGQRIWQDKGRPFCCIFMGDTSQALVLPFYKHTTVDGLTFVPLRQLIPAVFFCALDGREDDAFAGACN